MKKPDSQTENAFVVLEGNFHWELIKTWIKDSLEEQHKDNDYETVSDSIVRIGQGRAQVMRAILEEVKSAVDRKRKATRI